MATATPPTGRWSTVSSCPAIGVRLRRSMTSISPCRSGSRSRSGPAQPAGGVVQHLQPPEHLQPQRHLRQHAPRRWRPLDSRSADWPTSDRRARCSSRRAFRSSNGRCTSLGCELRPADAQRSESRSRFSTSGKYKMNICTTLEAVASAISYLRRSHEQLGCSCCCCPASSVAARNPPHRKAPSAARLPIRKAMPCPARRSPFATRTSLPLAL